MTLSSNLPLIITKKLHFADLIRNMTNTNIKKNLFTQEFTNLLKYDDRDVVILSLKNNDQLNSINLESIKEIYSWCHLFNLMPNKFPIFIGDKNSQIFCSGCDILYLYGLKSNREELWNYFNIVNYLCINSYIKQINKKENNLVVIWNGVNYGSGLALSLNSKIRIATETTKISTTNNFPFQSFNLNNSLKNILTQEESLIMSLTSKIYLGYEAYESKFATHFILNKHLRNVIGDIKEMSDGYIDEKEVDKILQFYTNLSLKEIDLVNSTSKTTNISSKLLSGIKIGQNFEDFYHELKEKLKILSINNIYFKEFYNRFNSQSLLLLKLNYELNIRNWQSNSNYESTFNLEVDYLELALEDIFESIRAFHIDKDHEPKWKITSFNQLNSINI